jgi:hypothetical protein
MAEVHLSAADFIATPPDDRAPLRAAHVTNESAQETLADARGSRARAAALVAECEAELRKPGKAAK